LNFSYEEKGKEKKGNMIFFDKMGEIKKIQKKGSTETRIIAKENLFLLGGRSGQLADSRKYQLNKRRKKLAANNRVDMSKVLIHYCPWGPCGRGAPISDGKTFCSMTTRPETHKRAVGTIV
jgi:hypothetical protein